LDTDPVREKRLFLEEKHEGKKEHLDGKSSMCEKHACKEYLTKLGLWFLQCIVMDDESRI
jgi:hypothetical protein